MTGKPDKIVVDGHAFSWKRLCELRKAQLEAWQAAQARQLVLFELHDDCRPKVERTAAGRYEEPTLLDLLRRSAEQHCDLLPSDRDLNR